MPATRIELESAVISAYCAANGVKPADARSGFATPDALDFDSLVGLELMVALEARFGVDLPPREGTRHRSFETLRSFTDMVERYVGRAAGAARAPAAAVPAARRNS